MNASTKPANHICRFEFRPVLACLLAGVGTLGLGDEARGQDLAADRQALVALYNAADGENWRNNENWLSDEPLDEWRGVTVSDGRVTELVLDRNGLTGPIPPELGQLSNLTDLFLYRNGLTGPIPPELGQLSSLQWLFLDRNALTGPIPPELGQLSNLSRLHLQHNQLTGPIPAELGLLFNLEEFSFRGNRLTGAVPAGLRHLPDVYVLNLRATRLAPDRIKVTWDDPVDPEATYQYQLWFHVSPGVSQGTGWAPIEDRVATLKKGEGVTIEWTLSGLRADRDYHTIAIRVRNATGHSEVAAPVTVPEMPVAPELEGEESLFMPVVPTSAGRNNAFFTSELTLTNRGSEEATLHYTCTADRGGGSGTATDRLAPGLRRVQPDAIGYLKRNSTATRGNTRREIERAACPALTSIHGTIARGGARAWTRQASRPRP